MAPPTFLYLSLFLFFFVSSFSTSLPPLSLFTLFFHLHFLPHFTISSLGNHLPKLPNLLSFISLNIFSDLCVLNHFFLKPIFLKPISKPPFFFFFFALIMSSFKRPSFLTFSGKKYHPSHEWNKEEGLLQDPKTYAPHSKMDFKVSFIF